MSFSECHALAVWRGALFNKRLSHNNNITQVYGRSIEGLCDVGTKIYGHDRGIHPVRMRRARGSFAIIQLSAAGRATTPRGHTTFRRRLSLHRARVVIGFPGPHKLLFLARRSFSFAEGGVVEGGVGGGN